MSSPTPEEFAKRNLELHAPKMRALLQRLSYGLAQQRDEGDDDLPEWLDTLEDDTHDVLDATRA